MGIIYLAKKVQYTHRLFITFVSQIYTELTRGKKVAKYLKKMLMNKTISSKVNNDTSCYKKNKLRQRGEP